jgi:outer membrane protein assembly factor BamB
MSYQSRKSTVKNYTWVLAVILFGAGASTLPAESFDWPQWQGQDRTAESRERGLLKEWPKDGPKLAWKAKNLGGGDSAPSVAGGKIIGMSIQGNEEVVWVLSEKTGKPIWTKPLTPAVRQRMPQSSEGPGCSPTIDGDRIYVIGMGGDVACMRISDGKILWRRSLTREFNSSAPRWSFRESPLIDGNKVICTPGGKGATMAALDKRTGKTIWQTSVADNPPRLPTPPPSPSNSAANANMSS